MTDESLPLFRCEKIVPRGAERCYAEAVVRFAGRGYCTNHSPAACVARRRDAAAALQAKLNTPKTP